MKIGQLAAQARCSTETIRFYEKKGLLAAPARSDSNYRHYGPAHLERLRFIRNCRSLDMTHDEIRALIQFMDSPLQDCEPVNDLLDEHIGHVELRLQELQRLRDELKALRRRCGSANAVGECGIIHGLTAMETDSVASRSHVG